MALVKKKLDGIKNVRVYPHFQNAELSNPPRSEIQTTVLPHQKTNAPPHNAMLAAEPMLGAGSGKQAKL